MAVSYQQAQDHTTSLMVVAIIPDTEDGLNLKAWIVVGAAAETSRNEMPTNLCDRLKLLLNTDRLSTELIESLKLVNVGVFVWLIHTPTRNKNLLYKNPKKPNLRLPISSGYQTTDHIPTYRFRGKQFLQATWIILCYGTKSTAVPKS